MLCDDVDDDDGGDVKCVCGVGEFWRFVYVMLWVMLFECGDGDGVV